MRLQKFHGFFLTLLCCVFFLFSGCTSYFARANLLGVPLELLAQNSRVILLISDDEKLKIVARLVYLNNIDNSLYYDKEYFFLEIFNDDEDIVLPDSIRLTMFGRKPAWTRLVEHRELDDILSLDNPLSQGFLIAFNRASPFEQKNIKIVLSIDKFKEGVFDFSYTILRSRL